MTLQFDTFVIFTKHFSIMNTDKKHGQITGKNTLELKRLGVVDKLDDEVISLNHNHIRRTNVSYSDLELSMVTSNTRGTT